MTSRLMTSRFTSQDLEAAVAAGAITPEAAQALRAFLDTRTPVAAPSLEAPRPRFDLTHLLWYAGALIIMGAMGLFSTLAFSQMGGAGLATTGLGYFLVLGLVGDRLWKNTETRTPGGLLIAAAIAMVPLMVFGLQEASGVWTSLGKPGAYRGFYHFIKGGWIPMELATLGVSLLAARRYSFAFIAFPAAIALWFLSMDLAAYLAGREMFDFEFRRKVSLWFGICTFFAVWLYELKARKADFAFWLHLVAAITFWGGLTFQSSDSELGKLLYCLINIALLAISLFVARRIYAVFGVIGVMIYLGHLAEKVFKNSLLFPFALSLVGIAIIALGLWVARHRARLEAGMVALIPQRLAALRPARARAET
jgi:hypothetical protein